MTFYSVQTPGETVSVQTGSHIDKRRVEDICGRKVRDVSSSRALIDQVFLVRQVGLLASLTD